MHEADAHGLGGGKALGGEPVAAEVAMPDRPDQERRDAERRHADAHFGNGKERAFGGDHNIATCSQRRTAADGGAVHDRDGRLRQRLERGKHIDQRRMRCRCLLLAVPRVKIGAGAKVLADAAQDDDARAFIARAREKLARQLVEHLLIESVGAFRPVEPDRRYAARRVIDFQRLHHNGHNSSPIAATALQRNTSFNGTSLA